MSKKAANEPQVIVYKTGKHHFEIAVDGSHVESYRASSGTGGLLDLLSSNHIYTSFSKGQIASTEELRSVFDMKSVNEIADLIARQGNFHASTADHRANAKNHKEAVLHYIHDNFVNKQTKLPVELADIVKSVEDHKIHIGEGDITTEANKVVHSLLGTYTLKEGDITGTMEIKAALAPVAMNVIHKYSRLKSESQTWFGDEMKYRVAVKPGEYAAFRSALDKVTKGDYKFELGQIETHEYDESESTATAHGSGHPTKEEQRADLKTAQLAKEIAKQEINANKHADQARANKSSLTMQAD